MIRDHCEMSTHQVCMKYTEQTFFLSLCDKVCDANPIGISKLSGILCASTAPTPYADASHARIIGRSGLKCTNTFDDNSNSLDCLNDSCSAVVHLHRVSLCNNV